MLISSLAFADAIDAYECLLELRIYTPAPLSSVVTQILIVRISMADIPPSPLLDIVIQIKIYSIEYHQKGHKKDTKEI